MLYPPAGLCAAPDHRQTQMALRHEIRLILQDPRFHYHDDWRWLREIFRAIGRFLFRQNQTIPMKFPAFWRPLLEWGGIAVLAIVSLILLYYLLKWFRPERMIAGTETAGHPASLSATELKERAERAAAGSDYREAVRYLYWAALAHLKAVGVIPPERQLSDRDCLRAFAREWGEGSPGYRDFRRLIQLFQVNWYGFQTGDASAYGEAVAIVNRILADRRHTT